MEDWEDEPAPVIKKKEPKSMWDDEDGVKDSWEDEDEPAPGFELGRKKQTMAELKSNEEPNVLPPKRKQTSQTLDEEDDTTKKLHLDNQPLAAVEDKPNNEIEDEEEEEEEDYEAEDELDSDDEDEHSNGEPEVDRKGKGVMKDDKGKGKMIEESEDDDDSSDEDGGGSESDGDDDDFSDDPLAEVDLDNILPSRTRRRTASRGVQISGGGVANDKENDA